MAQLQDELSCIFLSFYHMGDCIRGLVLYA